MPNKKILILASIRLEAKAIQRAAEFEARQKSKSEVLKKNAAAAGRALKDLANTPV